VIVAWRLASDRHSPLTGEGARLVGGRWNSPGLPLVYASESLALALVESLVHLPGRLPRDYAAFKLQVPDAHLEILERASLKDAWSVDIGYTRAIGDQWIEQNRTLALAVPSAILTEGTNILINPNHRALEELEVVRQEPFGFDPRLRPRP
jgi:RES domain-containing protein